LFAVFVLHFGPSSPKLQLNESFSSERRLRADLGGRRRWPSICKGRMRLRRVGRIVAVTWDGMGCSGSWSANRRDAGAYLASYGIPSPSVHPQLLPKLTAPPASKYLTTAQRPEKWPRTRTGTSSRTPHPSAQKSSATARPRSFRNIIGACPIRISLLSLNKFTCHAGLLNVRV
jgi:hypothetical protein